MGTTRCRWPRQIIAQGETRLKLVKNTYGRGVVGAIRTGFDAAPAGPVLVVMADLSDDLAQVGKMLELYRRGSHVVVGSRYMKGGRLIGGPWFKQLLSRLSGLTLVLVSRNSHARRDQRLQDLRSRHAERRSGSRARADLN